MSRQNKEQFVSYGMRCSVAILILMLSACASNMVLGKVYGGFGSRTAKQFKSHARFSAQQIAEIDKLADSYHSWHRSTQLPLYTALMRRIVADIDVDSDLSLPVAEGWWQSVQGFADQMRVCNPLNASGELLLGLTDKQVLQVADKLRADLSEREAEYLSENAEQRLAERISRITKWGKRAGASFNQRQKELLHRTLAEQISLGEQRYHLRRVWIEEFISLLVQRTQPDFKSKIRQHIDTVWQLTASTYPDQWQHNERLWISFFRDYINLQTDDQRERFSLKLLTTAGTLEKQAAVKVDAQPACYQGAY